MGPRSKFASLKKKTAPTATSSRTAKVARFLLSDFSTVEVLNVAASDPDLRGFEEGFTDGTYGDVNGFC